MKKFMKVVPALAVGIVLMLSSCANGLTSAGADENSSAARTAYSGTNGSISATGMTNTSLTVSYSPGSQKNYARLYVSQGNGTGLVLANQDMNYSGGTYSYTFSNGSFTSGAAIYVCVLVNDSGTEKCIPQGSLSDTTSWTKITYGSDTSASGSNGITSGSVYKIIAKCSSKSLDDDGWSKSNGANIIQWTWGGDQSNQKWIITDAGSGYYSIINEYSGLGLDVADWSTAAGGNIQQWAYSAQDNQKWAIEKLSDGYYKITNKYSGKVMDVSSSSTENGANVQQWNWNESSAQRWALTVVSATSPGSSTDETAPSTDGNYTLAWSDEFNGTSLNSSNWVYDTGTGSSGWGNNELEYYTNRTSNVSVSGGSLVITARKESYNGSSYTSGRIKTQGLKTFKYGKIEARIKMPNGQGLWPAFWMLGTNITSVSWPGCGEIDIMEHVNSDSNVVGTAHWDNNGHASWGCTTQNNYWNNFSVDVTQYHVYAVEWSSTAIKWYVDGTQYMELDTTNGTGGTEEFQKNFFIILNLAVGGNWPGNPNSATPFPSSMYVDYVRVYQ